MICNTQFRNKHTNKRTTVHTQKKIRNISPNTCGAKNLPQNIYSARRNVRPRERKNCTLHTSVKEQLFFDWRMVRYCNSIECNCVRSISLLYFIVPPEKYGTLLRIGQTKEFSKQKETLIAVYWLWLGRSTIIFIVRPFTFMIPV